MMRKKEIIALGQEYDELYSKGENKFFQKVTTTYKYRKEIRERTTIEHTEEGKRVFEILRSEKVFTCPCCQELCAWNDLESWLADGVEDFENDEVECCLCYENEMGDDL